MRPTLFRRFPRIRLKYTSSPLIPAEVAQNYPQFLNDFAILEDVLLPVYWQFDEQAVQAQNRYRGFAVVLLSSTALLAMLGCVRLALSQGANNSLAGTSLYVAATILAVFVGVFSQGARFLRTRSHYLDARRKAERLRALYFAYLGKRDNFAIDDECARQRMLRQCVLEIKHEQGARNA